MAMNSIILTWATKGENGVSFVFKTLKGEGITNNRDGLCYKNVLATYTHLHALGTRAWIEGMIHVAGAYKKNISID